MISNEMVGKLKCEFDVRSQCVCVCVCLFATGECFADTHESIALKNAWTLYRIGCVKQWKRVTERGREKCTKQQKRNNSNFVTRH